MADYELTFVLIFAALLLGGSIMVLLFPFVYDMTMGRGWGLWGAMAIPILGIGVAGVGLVSIFLGNSAFLIPIVGVVAALRVLSPTLTFMKVQGRWEVTKLWLPVKIILMIVFLAMPAYMAYRIFVPSTGDAVVLGERAFMCIGTALLFTRAYTTLLPHLEEGKRFLLSAGVLFALALGIVAPYAFPGYDVVYAVTGIAGWSIGFFLIIRSV